MSLVRRHGDHGHGHGHPSEDSVRQHFLACLYWYVLAAIVVFGIVARVASLFIARQR